MFISWKDKRQGAIARMRESHGAGMCRDGLEYLLRKRSLHAQTADRTQRLRHDVNVFDQARRTRTLLIKGIGSNIRPSAIA